jgi:hypothetical protein
MNRRNFLVCSTVSAVSCALPISLSLMTAPAFSAAVTQSFDEPLATHPSTREALFRLHNWEPDPEQRTPDDATARLISLSANWKAAWL